MNHEIESEVETEQVNEVRTKLETLQKRRADIEAQTDAAQTALQVAQRAAIDGDGTTAQLGKKRAELETLRELLGALHSEIEATQSEYDRVSYDARQDALLQTLHSACEQHLFIHHEAVVPVCEAVNAQWIGCDLQISAAEAEREIPREEARAVFEKLCPGVLNQLRYSSPSEEKQKAALALVNAMKAKGIDTSALYSRDEFNREYWLDGYVDALPDSGLNSTLQAARRPHHDDGPDHGDAHNAAVSVGGPLTPSSAASAQRPNSPTPAKETGPIYTNGVRDYVAESQRKNG